MSKSIFNTCFYRNFKFAQNVKFIYYFILFLEEKVIFNIVEENIAISLKSNWNFDKNQLILILIKSFPPKRRILRLLPYYNQFISNTYLIYSINIYFRYFNLHLNRQYSQITVIILIS